MSTPGRTSYTELGRIYFWTATIHNWYNLLYEDSLKIIITNSLKKLSDEGKVSVYAMVIKPNHIHLIWQQYALNGKETPKASFLKYTAHMFTRHLRATNEIGKYAVNESNKTHEIWQRDPKAIEIYSKAVAIQKLNYLHNNPLQDKWKLVKYGVDYQFSSARFYEYGTNDFGFLKNISTLFEDSDLL